MSSTGRKIRKRRGTCPECSYRVQLRKDGTVGGHLIYGAGFGGQPKSCSGAGSKPRPEYPCAGCGCTHRPDRASHIAYFRKLYDEAKEA